MARGRRPGVPNKNFPSMPLERALELPRAIHEGASGMTTDRLTLSELVDKSPSSSVFHNLILSSRAYGMTTGGKNADEFALTAIGRMAVSDNPVERTDGLRKALLNVDPFRQFLTAYDKKKVPQPVAFRSYLTGQAGVHADHVETAMEQLLADARLAGFLRPVKGAEWVDLHNTAIAPEPAPASTDEDADERDAETIDEVEDDGGDGQGAAEAVQAALAAEEARRKAQRRPSGIFIGHGKNKKPLEQLTKMLSEYKIPYKVAVDEANQGRPISQKVADVMDECGAAILIFTADRELKDADGKTIWQPSENVVYELGAAAVKYGSRIVIFKEEDVDFPTNFRDIGYISFTKDQLDAKAVDLIRELVAFGLLQLTVVTE